MSVWERTTDTGSGMHRERYRVGYLLNRRFEKLAGELEPDQVQRYLRVANQLNSDPEAIRLIEFIAVNFIDDSAASQSDHQQLSSLHPVTKQNIQNLLDAIAGVRRLFRSKAQLKSWGIHSDEGLERILSSLVDDGLFVPLDDQSIASGLRMRFAYRLADDENVYAQGVARVAEAQSVRKDAVVFVSKAIQRAEENCGHTGEQEGAEIVEHVNAKEVCLAVCQEALFLRTEFGV